MQVLDAITQRRAVKVFDPEHRISDTETDALIELAMLSPTAFNIQHWRFLVVRDVKLRQQLRAAAWDQAQVTDASLLVVLCADCMAWNKEPERYWFNAPQPVRDFLLPAIAGYYNGKAQTQRDEAMRSCGIAAQTLMLAAKAKGYDSCPMDGFDFDRVGQLIALPEDHLIAMFIAIGKALEPARPRGGQLPIDAVRCFDRF
ncbi:MAG: nitroreductase family protein [Methylococcales bacterium]|nr:nitroreductase family protein [Methylococcales bacterium]